MGEYEHPPAIGDAGEHWFWLGQFTVTPDERGAVVVTHHPCGSDVMVMRATLSEVWLPDLVVWAMRHKGQCGQSLATQGIAGASKSATVHSEAPQARNPLQNKGFGDHDSAIRTTVRAP